MTKIPVPVPEHSPLVHLWLKPVGKGKLDVMKEQEVIAHASNDLLSVKAALLAKWWEPAQRVHIIHGASGNKAFEGRVQDL